MQTLLCISLFATIKALSYLDSVPKDINVLFSKANTSNPVPLNQTALIDIQKIDIDTLMDKIGSINDSFLSDAVDVRKLGSINGSSLDGVADARKRGIPLDLSKVGSDAYHEMYTNAADIKNKQKLCDMMLQLIYMARHAVRRLESSPFFNKIDIGYRIAVLFSKLRSIHRRMRNIWQTMINADDDSYFAGNRGEINHKLHREDLYLIMHHRMVKLHTDFIYLFWVLIKIDGMFTEMNDIRIRLPQKNLTWGISIENKEIG